MVTGQKMQKRGRTWRSCFRCSEWKANEFFTIERCVCCKSVFTFLDKAQESRICEQLMFAKTDVKIEQLLLVT